MIPVQNKQDGPTGWPLLIVYAAFLGLCVLPIFLVKIPPIGDYLNHLARMHILAQYADSAELQRNYVVSWLPEPYIGMDLIIPAMSRVLGIYVAGSVFIAFIFLLSVAGTYAIHYALFRKHGVWPLFSLLFVYNYVFSRGFINYVFGAGLWLIGFGIWLRLERMDYRKRLLISAVVCFAIYLAHYFAVFGYGILLVSYEFGAWWSERPRRLIPLVKRALVAAPQFLIPFTLVLMLPKGDRFITAYGTFSEKLIALSSATRVVGSSFDRIILIVVLLGLIAGLATDRLRIAPRMRLPLVVLAIVVVLMPNIVDGVWGLDYRFPPVLMMLLVASSEFVPRSRALFRITCATAAALFIGHISTIYLAWRPTVARYAEFRSAMPEIGRGVRVLAFVDPAGSSVDRPRLEDFYAHLPAMAIIERDVFLPYLIKLPIMSVHAAEMNRIIDTPQGSPPTVKDIWDGTDPDISSRIQGTYSDDGERRYWGNWPQNFDYAIGLYVSADTKLPRNLVPIHQGSFFTIYRVEK